MSWLEHYLDALYERDSEEHAAAEIYQHYAQLADKRSHHRVFTEPTEIASNAPGNQNSSSLSLSNRWQEELLEAQRRRSELERNLSVMSVDLEILKTRVNTEQKRTERLNSENTTLTLKLRDRAEELKGKTKMLEDLQDEALALNVQINVSSDQNTKLAKENRELINRWMARVGQEADAMNDASNFS